MAMGADPYSMPAKAGLGLAGGFFGARRKGQAIKQAGTTLANAYNQAAEDAWKLPGMVNPGIARAYGTAGEDVFNTAYGSAANIEARGTQGRQGVYDAVAQGRGDITGAVERGRGDLAGYLDPYARAGEGALTSLSELAGAKAPTLEQLQMDPGYAFRLAEGQKALERSAAGRGLLSSGSFAKSLGNYAQGAASQEYANAFDRYMRGQEQRRQSLTTLAGLGGQAAATAGTTMANLGLQGAETMGTLGLRGAEAAERFGFEGTKQAGDWTNEAARWKGRAGIDSELAQAGNIINAHNAATGYGLNASGATAASQQGLGNVWGDFYSQTGNTLGDLAGGMLQQQGGGWPNQGRIPGLPPQYSIPGSPSYNDYYPSYSRRGY